MGNLKTFKQALEANYTSLFELPDYAFAASRQTPEGLANKMSDGLQAGTASKDGEGIKRTCKELGIKHTYKAISEYLGQ